MVQLGWMPDPAAVQADRPGAKPPLPIAEEKPDDQKPEPGPDLAAKSDEASAKAEPDKPEQFPRPKDAAPQAKPYGKPLVLGSLDRASGYHFSLQVDQEGAGIARITSSLYDGERIGRAARFPLVLLKSSRNTPDSFSLNLITVAPEAKPGEGGDAPASDVRAAETTTIRLENRLWEVVADDGEPAVQPIFEPDRATKKPVEVGQQITLRVKVGKPAVTVTKTYTLRKGQDGLEMELSFTGQGEGRRIAYELNGPRGMPIEGEWYTNNFRDVFVEQAGGTGIVTETAHEVVKAEEKGKEQRFSKFPLAFAGVENQYFAVFFATEPETRTPDRRWDQETVPAVAHKDEANTQKSDVSVVMTSRDFEVGRNLSTTHRYRIYAGPKTPDRLTSYDATELASFRKGWSMLGVGTLARNVAQYVITPLLDGMYDVTLTISRIFGGARGNYGIAIIMLVIAVRLSLFPISRKQAIMAKKMQELQPQLSVLRAKYKEDPARLMKESQALQRKNGVSMLGGCLPALIQIPIFMGLWQALNNSFALRQEPFLFWVRDLSAPDMLFLFPFDMEAVPLVGPMLGPYFNVLPLVSAALMLVHTKLFAPPPTTPEAEMQQKMMKYMMVFMAVMLYRVPSGLGIYFITSSSWAIAERILLPKTVKHKPIVTLDDDEPNKHSGGGKGSSDDPPTPSSGGWLARKFEKILEEAAKDPTIRNKIEKIRDPASTPGDRDRNRDGDRGKPRPRPRTRPGKRR